MQNIEPIKITNQQRAVILTQALPYIRKYYDKIVCVSKQAQEGFIELIGLKEKTTAIYNMVPIDTVEEKAKEFCKESKLLLILAVRLILDITAPLITF